MLPEPVQTEEQMAKDLDDKKTISFVLNHFECSILFPT